MRKQILPLLMGLMALVACAGSGSFHPIHLDALVRPRIKIVTAVGANQEGPVDPKDHFTTRESICVYSTFIWMAGTIAAPVEIQMKCYRDGALVYTGRHSTALDMSPWHVWFDIPPSLLGAGKYKVDVCVKDAVLDSHEFEIAAS